MESNIWSITVTLSGIFIAALMPFIIHGLEKQKKQLEYIVITNTSVLPISWSKLLKVTFRKNTVSNARVVIIRIVNTGNVSILESDFSTNLNVSLANTSTVVATVPVRTKPEDLIFQTNITNGQVSISPTLINPGDMIELLILTSGNVNDVKLNGRVADTKLIRRPDLPFSFLSDSESKSKYQYMTYTSPGLIIGILFVVAILTSGLTEFAKIVIVSMILFSTFVLNPLIIRHLDRKRETWR